MDNLTRAIKPFHAERSRTLARIARRVHIAPTIAQKISAIALQRNKH